MNKMDGGTRCAALPDAKSAVHEPNLLVDEPDRPLTTNPFNPSSGHSGRKLIGEDAAGNQFFEIENPVGQTTNTARRSQRHGRRWDTDSSESCQGGHPDPRREVTFPSPDPEDFDMSLVATEWRMWLYHHRDDPPTEAEIQRSQQERDAIYERAMEIDKQDALARAAELAARAEGASTAVAKTQEVSALAPVNATGGRPGDQQGITNATYVYIRKSCGVYERNCLGVRDRASRDEHTHLPTPPETNTPTPQPPRTVPASPRFKKESPGGGGVFTIRIARKNI